MNTTGTAPRIQLRPTPVNVLIRGLSQTCRDHLLAEKWILAPSRRAGHQWLEAVARAGQPVVNGHVTTLTRLALDLAGPAMVQQQLKFISARQGALLVGRVMERLRNPDGGYLWQLSPGVRLAETVCAAIDALRCAGLASDDVKIKCFEVDVKGRELQDILREYTAELGRRNWIDRAGVLKAAIDRLTSSSGALPEGVLVVIPGDLDAKGLERRLLDLLPEKHRVPLPVDQPAPAPAAVGEEPSTDARLLRSITAPAEAPAPCSDGSAGIFRAVGAANEVRGVLRRLLADGIPLDQVEVLCTDVATYVPLIYETFAALLPDQASLDDIPVTFQEGIPARKLRPGRALIAWLDWTQSDFPQQGLIQMIQERLVSIPDHDPGVISFSRLAAILRGIGIGFGRERYLDALARYEQALDLRRRDPQPLCDEDGEVIEPADGPLDQRLAAVRLLRGLIESLLDLSARPGDTTRRVLELAQRFLEERTRGDSQLDNYARGILIDRIKEMCDCLDQDEDASYIHATGWLAALPEDAWVGGLGPRGGCLHVAHVLAGGHSGRPNTFIVGLDDGRFPGAGLQDPILLDDERQGLSRDLMTSGQELSKKFKHMALLLSRLRGRVTLSYSCYDLADDREIFPSPVVLAAFRILSGQHDGDQAALNRWLAPAESFAPDSPQKALTESQWWLWRMSGPEDVVEPRDLVAARFPHLARGFTLAEERASDRFTIFDGWIPDPGAEINPTVPGGPVVSASQLETLGQCPLRYFFRYVLDIEPPDEFAIEEGVWLDPRRADRSCTRCSSNSSGS